MFGQFSLSLNIRINGFSSLPEGGSKQIKFKVKIVLNPGGQTVGG